jgi:hypothetical protein
VVIGNTLKYTRSSYDDNFKYVDSPDKKYDKYFVSETPPNGLHPQNRQKYSDRNNWNYFCIDEECNGKLPNAFWLCPNQVLRTANKNIVPRPHNHDYDEYLVFFSLDPNNLSDLGGETEVFIEGEKHIITKTTAFLIPKGVYHAAFGTNKLDRPYGTIGIALTPKYAHLSFSEDPEYVNGPTLDEIAQVTLGGKNYKITKTYAEYLTWLIERNRKIRP